MVTDHVPNNGETECSIGSTKFSDDESHSSDGLDASMQSVPTPETVKEWTAQLLGNSRRVGPEDLRSYIPVVSEQTPRQDFRRQPLNLEYYQNNMQCPGRGPRFLTAHSIIKSRGSVNQISPKSSLWCALLAKLSDRITVTDQQILVALLHHMRQEMQQSPPDRGKESDASPCHFRTLPVPRTHNELRNSFVSGRQSYTEILPRPAPIQILDNGFVYVPIRAILQYHLANGQPLDPLVDLPYYGTSSLPALHGSSPRGIELISFRLADKCSKVSSSDRSNLPMNEFPTEVTIWSDGFDPSEKKNNRGSAHVIFVSIGSLQDEYHSGRNTYPVSLGPADGDLSVVAEKVAEELAELFVQSSSLNVFFEANSQKEMAVFLRVFCFLQDRPERCHWLCLAHGNGKFGARFGWAGDLTQEIPLIYLPSCQGCNTWRLNNANATTKRTCTNCFDWDFTNIHFHCPEDFPEVFKTGHDDLPPFVPTDPRKFVNGMYYLPFKRIHVSELKTACESTFKTVSSNLWSKKEGRAYLETFGISPDFINRICITAEAICKTKQDEPMPKLPATWSIPGVDIFHHIDVPMHLCFLGITKAIFSELVSGWLKGGRKSTSFLQKSQPALGKIRKLSLSWCQVETKFGGFVSENWLAYCRISKYTYQLLKVLETKDVLYHDPHDLPLSNYNLTQKRAWLLARQIPGIEKKSTKTVVEHKFKEYLNLPEGELLPGIVRPAVSKALLDDVMNMVVCWHVCMSRVMSLDQNPTDPQVSDIERHVKFFLTSVQEFDKTRCKAQAELDSQRKRKVVVPPNKRQKRNDPIIIPVWKRKPNFLGLLNFPDAIRHFGPIRVLTELDLKGEAAIKLIKSKMNQGLSGNWAYNAMLGYYRERSFKTILKDCLIGIGDEAGAPREEDPMIHVAAKIAGEMEDDENGRNEGVIARPRYKKFQKFRKSTDALESLEGNHPISGIVWKGGFYLLVEESTVCCALEIEPLVWGARVCGGDYFSWKKLDWRDESATKEILKEAREYFLLLPALIRLEGSFFYAITSEWKEVVKRGNRYVLTLPEIPGASY